MVNGHTWGMLHGAMRGAQLYFSARCIMAWHGIHAWDDHGRMQNSRKPLLVCSGVVSLVRSGPVLGPSHGHSH